MSVELGHFSARTISSVSLSSYSYSCSFTPKLDKFTTSHVKFFSGLYKPKITEIGLFWGE